MPSPCEELVSCLNEIAGANLFDLLPADASRDDFCTNVLDAYQGQHGIDTMCTVAANLKGRLRANSMQSDAATNLRVKAIKDGTAPQSPHEFTFHGRARHLAAPTCETIFRPDYADDSGSGTPYDTLVAPLQNYLPGGKNRRSNSDAYSALFLGYLTALVAAGAAAGVPFVENGAQVVLAAVQVTVESINVHDGNIDATEIQAAFENSQKILTQSCNLISQVETFERTANNRFGDIDSTINIFRSVVNTRFNTVDASVSTLTNSIVDFRSAVNTRFNTVDASITTLTNNVDVGFDTTFSHFESVDSDLAVLKSSVATGFSNVETTATTRFGNIDAAIMNFESAVNTRFNTVDASITTLTNNVEIGFDATFSRFDSVDSDLVALNSSVATGFSNVYKRFDQLESLVNTRLNVIEATLEARFTQLDDLLAIARTLLITPEGRRTGWNSASLICDGKPKGNCATVPNFP